MFDRLLGNEQVKDVLRRMIEKERVPRSLLFAGPDGIGKRRFAFEVAKSFVCSNRRGVEACDECTACRRADIFTFPKPDAKKDEFERVFFSEHIDVGTVIPCRANILVDSIRHLEREANFRPYEAKARFFVIDDAHKMNDAASNALLKTLEEPSSTSHIFLITSRPDGLLQTIRSRCQTIRFAPVAAAEIERKILTTQRFSPTDAPLVARLAAGSIGRALDFDVEKFRARRETMLGVLKSLGPRPDLVQLLSIGEEMNDAKNKDDFEVYLETLQTLVHDIWTLACGGSKDALVNVDLQAQFASFAASLGTRRLAGWLTEIESLRESLAVNVNKKIAADALFVKMAAA